MPNSNPEKRGEPRPEKPAKAGENAQAKVDKPDGQKRKWDIIDENAWESFPASDPPASWAGRDIAPQEREAQEAEAEQPETRKLRKDKH